MSFYYPDTGNDRSDFFSRELMQFLLLGSEENLPLREVTGSYAGAMGLGQFMPSSYREYAVDLDGDGRRDLWSSMPDIIGSVANYLHRHGWEAGQPVAWPATVAPGADMSLVAKRDFKPRTNLAELAAGGFSAAEAPCGDGVPDTTLATVVRPRGRRRRPLLAHLQEFLRDHPLQPQPALRHGGVRAERGHPGRVRASEPAVATGAAAPAAGVGQPAADFLRRANRPAGGGAAGRAFDEST